ncbi:MAG: Glutamine amidotransferase, class-II, partial [Myxococcaceae bacterium]|nr:Glutamine amidotransferase, class-II [Myxococcaceae bacterium]
LLGIVASEKTAFRLVLRDAKRSLAALSREHPDGWGIAVHGGSGSGWTLDKGVACATDDDAFHRSALESHGQVLVSHVRKKTVGATSEDNTHPFQSGRWVFAHNGTVTATDDLRAATSPERLSAVRGSTDSELLFAYMLTHLDEKGLVDAPADTRTNDALAARVRGLYGRAGYGSLNFLLSNGDTTFAHRLGRTLFLLERGPHDAVVKRRSSEDGTAIETTWSQRRRAVFVASERLTDEPWTEVPEHTLLRIDRLPQPAWYTI